MPSLRMARNAAYDAISVSPTMRPMFRMTSVRWMLGKLTSITFLVEAADQLGGGAGAREIAPEALGGILAALVAVGAAQICVPGNPAGAVATDPVNVDLRTIDARHFELSSSCQYM